MDLGEVGWGDVDWIGLAKDRNRWRALVNSALNRVAYQLLASQVVLSSIELVQNVNILNGQNAESSSKC
jgi:hypothetical protein